MPRLLLLFSLLALAGSGCKSGRREVVVFAAASLARALSDLEQQLEARHPDLDLRLEISGSQVACRKVAELNRRGDVVAVADHQIIERILRPTHAEFNIRFATNAVVLAHMQHSRHTEQITAKNWPQVLQRPGVRLGRVDPDLAPMGYRTLLVWQLAARQRGTAGRGLAARLAAKCAPEHVAPHEGQLLQLLQARSIDYAFVYRSTAEEHNLKTVQLPDAINLGAASLARAYAAASVRVSAGRRGSAPQLVRGAPVLYGLTIPRSAPNPAGAARVVASLLGSAGQRSLKRTGFRPLTPARCQRRHKLPALIKPLVR